MLLKIVIAVGLVIASLATVVALQPDDFRVTRSALIPASPEVVFDQVNDLHKWEAWSPWADVDPEMVQTYEGPSEGEGASYTWSGNMEVGAGRNTIVETRPNEMVRLRLDMEKPFACSNDVEFTFVPEGEATRVSWTMAGKSNFVSKAMGLVMDCDKICGGQFEQGLAKLGTVVETQAAR